ncbi:6-phosphogluconolactonase [Aporhodopirellula aestuarii]|uniref:6-phosphogluconolactonase n=1 Tax=Aporhodopirellula aestuarii TaxID=2950107 RepID=A0ABT0U852_9BACT|nr:6-phosphogluconolactonase [Aporhodopirellula aestuarii]MCM2373068.1 6-phosphogluconolactonase [Aporhodopirellula aestuarii]
MTVETKKFADPSSLAAGFAKDFAAWVGSQSQDKICVALSGGSTPKMLFDLWASEYSDAVDWSRLHFFWGDERCVPPNDPESNYGVAKELFFDKVGIADQNIHRVHGEADPEQERGRYEDEIRATLASDETGLPRFDLMLLGMGDDGHTASIFPHQRELLESSRVCEVAQHPVSGQTRITLTGPVIKAAAKIVFLVTGKAKADVLADVIQHRGAFETYPASYINEGDVVFYVDGAAAEKL